MTPWELAKPGCKEDAEQRALFCWANCAASFGFEIAADPRGYVLTERSGILALVRPVPAMNLLFAIHNQGHGDVIRGGRARAEGVKAGVPDLMLPVPLKPPYPMEAYSGLFIELKRRTKGVIGTAQTPWIANLRAQGYRVEVAIGWNQAANVIAEYMGTPVRVL